MIRLNLVLLLGLGELAYRMLLYFPCPHFFCQPHIPRPERYFPDVIFLPVRFPVESDAVPRYYNVPRKRS